MITTAMSEHFFKVSKTILEAFASVDNKGSANNEERLTLLHNLIKSSLCEQVMPLVLTALSSERMCDLASCKTLVSPVVELTVLLAKVTI